MTKKYELTVNIDEFYLTEETHEKDVQTAIKLAMKILSNKGIYLESAKEKEN